LTGQAGQLVRLPELGSRLAVGETGVVCLDLFLSIQSVNICWLQDVLPPPSTGAQTVFQSTQENHEKKDVVVAVKHTVYAIAWLAVNQSVMKSNVAINILLSTDPLDHSSMLLLQRINQDLIDFGSDRT
jgi:hypothetical protein